MEDTLLTATVPYERRVSFDKTFFALALTVPGREIRCPMSPACGSTKSYSLDVLEERRCNRKRVSDRLSYKQRAEIIEGIERSLVRAVYGNGSAGANNLHADNVRASLLARSVVSAVLPDDDWLSLAWKADCTCLHRTWRITRNVTRLLMSAAPGASRTSVKTDYDKRLTPHKM